MRIVILIATLLATPTLALDVHPDKRVASSRCWTWGNAKTGLYRAVVPFARANTQWDTAKSNYPVGSKYEGDCWYYYQNGHLVADRHAQVGCRLERGRRGGTVPLHLEAGRVRLDVGTLACRPRATRRSLAALAGAVVGGEGVPHGYTPTAEARRAVLVE